MIESPDRETCNHDIEGALNPSRFVWICPKCKCDISLLYLLLSEAMQNERNKKQG